LVEFFVDEVKLEWYYTYVRVLDGPPNVTGSSRASGVPSVFD